MSAILSAHMATAPCVRHPERRCSEVARYVLGARCQARNDAVLGSSGQSVACPNASTSPPCSFFRLAPFAFRLLLHHVNLSSETPCRGRLKFRVRRPCT